MRIKVKFANATGGATIPSKVDENVGVDIYIDKKFLKSLSGVYTLPKNATTMIPTGLIAWCEDSHYFNLANRGSNGSQGILQACGIIEGEYQGEWFVAMANTNDHDVIILDDYNMSDLAFQEEILARYRGLGEKMPKFYPSKKGICQAILLPKPLLDIEEVSVNEILSMPSTRGDGKLGSSGK